MNICRRPSLEREVNVFMIRIVHMTGNATITPKEKKKEAVIFCVGYDFLTVPLTS